MDDLAGRYAEVAAAHPEWADLTATFSQGGPYDGQLYVYPAGLGDRVPHRPRLHDDRAAWRSTPSRTAPRRFISAENVGLIDADVVVFATESDEMFDELQSFGTIDTLPAVAEERAAYTDEVLAGAIYFLSPR